LDLRGLKNVLVNLGVDGLDDFGQLVLVQEAGVSGEGGGEGGEHAEGAGEACGGEEGGRSGGMVGGEENERVKADTGRGQTHRRKLHKHMYVSEGQGRKQMIKEARWWLMMTMTCMLTYQGCS